MAIAVEINLDMEMVMKKLFSMGRASMVTKAKYVRIHESQIEDGLVLPGPNPVPCADEPFGTQNPVQCVIPE